MFDSDLARYSNPWTIEIQSRSGSWSNFCHDAPRTLAECEEREMELREENPSARFRVVPWFNASQWQFLRENFVSRGPE